MNLGWGGGKGTITLLPFINKEFTKHASSREIISEGHASLNLQGYRWVRYFSYRVCRVLVVHFSADLGWPRLLFLLGWAPWDLLWPKFPGQGLTRIKTKRFVRVVTWPKWNKHYWMHSHKFFPSSPHWTGILLVCYL